MDKKQRILDAALRLFNEQGFHGTPTSKIAQEAGVANGTLFHYFGTKDELIIALYIAIKDQLAGYIAAQPIPEGNSMKTVMKTQYMAALYWALDHHPEFRFTQQFMNSPYTALIDPAEAEKYVRPHHAMLEAGIAAKVIKPLPVDLLYSLIMSHTYGLNDYLAKGTFSTPEQHRIIDETFELLWDMIT